LYPEASAVLSTKMKKLGGRKPVTSTKLGNGTNRMQASPSLMRVDPGFTSHNRGMSFTKYSDVENDHFWAIFAESKFGFQR
jgi:hypothetical protein